MSGTRKDSINAARLTTGTLDGPADWRRFHTGDAGPTHHPENAADATGLFRGRST